MMVLNFLRDYLKHRFTANTRHGTHSPFVYALADKVIYDFKPFDSYERIEEHRRKLAGDSTKNKELAGKALKSKRLDRLIFRITQQLQPENIIEIGTNIGVTTGYLAMASPESNIFTLTDNPETARIAYQNFQKLELKNVEIRVGYVDELFPELLGEMSSVELVCINEKHSGKTTIKYFEACLPKVHENSLIIVDGIYWSPEMKDTWAAIKIHPQVTVTVDLFWIGLVYFKTDQAKEHFKLKF